MMCVGLTGTIASGKSTVAAYFQSLHIDVISADDIARELTAVGQPALTQIAQYFGDAILTHDGALNRRLLRTIIFQNTQHRIWLEQLLHPLIREQIIEKIKNSHSPYCMIEIPLLKNRIDYPYLQRVLLITTDQKTQIQRLMMRDHCSKKEAIQMIQQQPSPTHYTTFADDIVYNHGDLSDLLVQLNPLHQHYLLESQADIHRE